MTSVNRIFFGKVNVKKKKKKKKTFLNKMHVNSHVNVFRSTEMIWLWWYISFTHVFTINSNVLQTRSTDIFQDPIDLLRWKSRETDTI